MENDSSSPWASLGILDPGEVSSLLVNRTAGVLVAVLHVVVQSEVTCERLYYRGFRDARYSRLEPSNPFESQRDARSCSDVPFVVFTSTAFRRTMTSQFWAAEDTKICRLDLRTGTRADILKNEDLVVEEPYTRAFLREIIEAYPDGTGAIVTLGLERREADKRKIDHGVFELAFDTGALKKLADLSGTAL
jgi:hypothetical protein